MARVSPLSRPRRGREIRRVTAQMVDLFGFNEALKGAGRGWAGGGKGVAIFRQHLDKGAWRGFPFEGRR